MVCRENIAITVYNFSTFERGENPLFDVCALFTSLAPYLSKGHEPFIRLNMMYYERRRHYKFILNIKSAPLAEDIASRVTRVIVKI